MQETNPSPSLEEQLLGEINAQVVGIQQHDAVVQPGEQVNLEREPENVHDKTTIRVENRHFQSAGHLPQDIAARVAPLIDTGKIRLDGYVP